MLREQDLQRHNSKHEQHCWRRFCHQGTCYPGGIKGRLCSSDHMAETTLPPSSRPEGLFRAPGHRGRLDSSTGDTPGEEASPPGEPQYPPERPHWHPGKTASWVQQPQRFLQQPTNTRKPSWVSHKKRQYVTTSRKER